MNASRAAAAEDHAQARFPVANGVRRPTTSFVSASTTGASSVSTSSTVGNLVMPTTSSPMQSYYDRAPDTAVAPRSSNRPDDDTWAKAIHAVRVQRMSLRQAAQLYGVHHMSLHRRVRGRYATSLPPSFDIRSYLSPDDEAEALGVLREQFLHEKRITSDDIRFVVRAIASQGGKRSIPAEFPPSRWIAEFKRIHGLTKLNNYAYPPNGQQRDQEMEEAEDSGSNYSGYSASSYRRGRRSSEYNYKSMDRNSDADRDEYVTPASTNGNAFSESSGTTTGSSSGGSYDNGETEKRSYQLSHTVPPEVWEKAIEAVEQDGMSLRAAARKYNVHFAALHRRVKKRAQSQHTPGMNGYFHPDDEAGIIRVVVARAELGVLMTFDELMDLVQRAALRNLPDLTIEAARKLLTRFQTRNEHSIRHIISDWPVPRAHSLKGDSGGEAKREQDPPPSRMMARSSSMPPPSLRPNVRMRSPMGAEPRIRALPPVSSQAGDSLSPIPPLRGDLPAPSSFLARPRLQPPHIMSDRSNGGYMHPSLHAADRRLHRRDQDNVESIDDESKGDDDHPVMFV
ncbi:hypothetical protein Poli38472_002669 [Pythium oligandrum]|uniref:HTH psq-type domain-containing protein n=1 Tax=Pythium oligandrum TaxID=41045 RepID=A0A8K1CJU2_PYTOL|nr:hypothetical protein Poli38472_002669 [Pythium oligandrum]|eukprot:TMW63728.1 hypothetical protein Poli38472_002669 [Pythium oligandrum]